LLFSFGIACGFAGVTEEEMPAALALYTSILACLLK
jgi:hypothetical protein